MLLSRAIEISNLHPSYPVEVRAMARPPCRLFLRGELPRGPSVAIVGTRSATSDALRFTLDLASRLAQCGVTVWSGGADGIDTAAHEGALRVQGRTVVVMGTGFDHTYPSGNHELFERVLLGGGAWLSPFSPAQRGARWTFLLRNELLAALVDDVVVIQAPIRSGARSTAAAARRLGKRVWAVPASPWDYLGAGCLAEIGSGARALVDPAQLEPHHDAGSNRGNRTLKKGQGTGEAPWRSENLGPDERSVLAAVEGGAAHPDAICERTGFPAGTVAAALMILTLRHILLESSDGHYHLVNS